MNKVFLSYLFVLSIISMNIAAQSTAYKVSYDDEKFFKIKKNDKFFILYSTRLGSCCKLSAFQHLL